MSLVKTIPLSRRLLLGAYMGIYTTIALAAGPSEPAIRNIEPDKVNLEKLPPPENVPPVPRLEAKTPLPEPNNIDPPAQTVMDSPNSGEMLSTPEIITEIKSVHDTVDDTQNTTVQPVVDAPDSCDSLSTPENIISITPPVRIEPQYPPRALRAGIEGTVTVEFTIAVDGSVKDIEIVSADPPKIFDNEVLKALKLWKFLPQTVDGKTVEKRARQDIRFTLHKRK